MQVYGMRSVVVPSLCRRGFEKVASGATMDDKQNLPGELRPVIPAATTIKNATNLTAAGFRTLCMVSGRVQNAPHRSRLGRNAHPVTPTLPGLPGTCAPDLLLLRRLERAGRRAAEDRKTVARPSDRQRPEPGLLCVSLDKRRSTREDQIDNAMVCAYDFVRVPFL